MMSFHPSDLGEFLAAEGLTAPEAMARARAVATETNEPLHGVLTRLGVISEARLAQAVAEATETPWVEAEALPKVAPLHDQLSDRFLRRHHCCPIEAASDAVRCVFADPFDPFPARALAFALRRPVEVAVARSSDITGLLDRTYGANELEDPTTDEADEDDLDRLADLASDAPVVRAVNQLISRAWDARASDIHFEPTEDALRVRFRIDGDLQDEAALPAAYRAPLASRIKVMAGLNIAERRLPQDGRMRLTVRGHDLDLRVATSPCIHGENLVLRLLDRSNLSLDFSILGFDDEIRRQFENCLATPHGITLVTGPTGSGKTTTLYAALTQLNRPERKVLTIEDPIEYRLPGINQTQTNPQIGLNFASALRSFLRQDPDVIMVGEIRDLETAQIAVQAALTGHALLSTVHTNSAASTMTRLIDIGVEPYLIPTTVNAVLAQRLARRLCPECRLPVPASAEAIDALGLKKLKRHDTFWRPNGCEQCGGRGYKGRVALSELLRMTPEIADLVLHRADARPIQKAAVESGMRTMIEDGVLKAARGLTTLEEVMRVTRDE